MNTKQIIEKMFKDPTTQYELTEFETLGKPIHDLITIYPKVIESGREAGKTKYFMKSFIPFSSGKEEVQVYSEDGKSNPEEIVRQLWVYKLLNVYEYKPEEIELETSVRFGNEVYTKAADIMVYTDSTKITPKIIIEVKKPKRKDGIEQLKSYMMSKGAPVAVWSNGSEKVLLYRPYPEDFEDTLVDIPRRGESPKNVIEKRRTLADLDRHFNFKGIVYEIEELALANYGDGVFEEIFKLIFAKIYDEIEAEDRPNKEVFFRKSDDPNITYGWINGLFQKASEKWPGIFKVGDKIDLKSKQLSICIGPLVKIRLMGSNLRIMDDAFEYLVPSVLKKKDGQFFTPRHVIDMCVRMLNPKQKEYILDPACGSAGFLLHAMDWCYPVSSSEQMETRKHKYASKYLWGIDFSEKASKTSRALMLIAGDGHSNIYGPRASSLDPSDWLDIQTGRDLIEGLRREKLLAKMPNTDKIISDEDSVWEYYDNLKFDLILTNPPFAGEIPGKKLLSHYELAKKALKTAGDKKTPIEERDVLFIERIIKWLKPGGRAAIVLPQGKFNNSSLAFIREWILRKARLLAVVGLHGNTFRPHTGTKTSVLFIQKYTDEELQNIEKVKQTVAAKCPDYEKMLRDLIANKQYKDDVPEEEIPEAIAELMLETFNTDETETEEQEETGDEALNAADSAGSLDNEERIDAANEKIDNLKRELIKTKEKLGNMVSDLEALNNKKKIEIEVLEENWAGNKKELNAEKKITNAKYKEEEKVLKEKQKAEQKRLKAEIKALESAIPEAEYELKLLSNKGKLQIILEDGDLIGALKNRWIDAEVAKKLDYPIFMAVSEKGGKNNSGDYEHMTDENGNLMEFPNGHPQEGQPIIKQDLVNYNLTAKDLVDAKKRPDDKLCIAEAFVRFAQKNKFDFWEEE
jgi:type I restriction enzyme M protein